MSGGQADKNGGAAHPAARVLLTAFEPFHGSEENASLAALALLRSATDWPADTDLRTAELPVDTARVSGVLHALLGEHDPSVVVLLGESAKAEYVTIERLAVNLLDFRIADNAGVCPIDEPVELGGPAALWATLPVRACEQAVAQAGGSAVLSLSAGAYLCNQALYVALRACAARRCDTGRAPLAGFLHLPSLPSQVARGERKGPSLPAEQSAAAVRAVVTAAVAEARRGVDNPGGH